MGKMQHISEWEIQTQNNNNNDFYFDLQKNDLTYINYINQAPKGASNIQGITQLWCSIKKLETIINIKSNFRRY